MRLKRWLLATACCLGFVSTAQAQFQSTPVKSMVVFGDSLSDMGNTTHLLKSLRMDEDPAYLVYPLKMFVFNKIDDFAAAHYVPHSVVAAGKSIIREFLDQEVGPILAGMVGSIRTLPLIPESPYWEHRFSDGEVWSERLAENLGLNPYNKNQFINEAFGGSWATTYDHQLTTWNLIRHPILSLTNLIQGKLIPPSLGLAVEGYLMKNRMKADPNSLYFIFAGGNDYLNVLSFEDNYNPANMEKYINNAVSSIVYNTEKLVKSGAKHVVLFEVPDIGITPRYIDTSDQNVLSQATSLHNARLNSEVRALKEKYKGVKFSVFHLQNLFRHIVRTPEKYHMSNSHDACMDLPLPGFAFTQFSPSYRAFGHNYVLEYTQYMYTRTKQGGLRANFHECADHKQYVFWDEVHPTAEVHKLLASELFKQLQKEGYSKPLV